MVEKLGKITDVRFGHVGYQDCQMGLQLQFSVEDGGAVGHGIYGGWIMERSSGATWTEEDRVRINGEMVAKIGKVMKEARVDDVMQLVHKPVKLTFNGMELKEWRILTEVL